MRFRGKRDYIDLSELADNQWVCVTRIFDGTTTKVYVSEIGTTHHNRFACYLTNMLSFISTFLWRPKNV